jgi:hypothetical protein
MARTGTPTRSNTSGPDQPRDIGTGHAIPGTVRRKARIPPFWQHFLEMFAAMWIGMAAGKPVFLAITGLSSTRQASQLYPAQSCGLLGGRSGYHLPAVCQAHRPGEERREGLAAGRRRVDQCC